MKADRRRAKVKVGRMNSIVAGIDLGDRESLATVLSPTGDVADRFTFPMNEEGYAYFASRVPKHARVAFESTIMAYPISRALRMHGYGDVTVAHPKTLAWIVRSKKKNDRVDSLKIAKLHMAGMLPESHLLDRDEQIVRDVLVQRVKLGVEIGRLKNSVIGYLKREGVYDSLTGRQEKSSPRYIRAHTEHLKFKIELTSLLVFFDLETSLHLCHTAPQSRQRYSRMVSKRLFFQRRVLSATSVAALPQRGQFNSVNRDCS
jgi:hypothetical protein